MAIRAPDGAKKEIGSVRAGMSRYLIDGKESKKKKETGSV